LTKELTEQLKAWLRYKYRTRSIGYYDKNTRTATNKIIHPVVNPQVFIFSSNPTNDEIELGNEKRKMVATINKPKQAKKDYTLSLSVLESKEKIKELQLKLLLEEEE
jgi:hypothetical protein